MIDYCKIIKDKRLKLGLSQNKLAKQVGISQPFMNEIEIGSRNSSFKVLNRICNELNIEIQFIDKEIDT